MSDSKEMASSDVSLESVLSTGKLTARPFRTADYETENRALLAIAQHMADSPRTTLQKLAEVALEVCRAGSAGVSLLSKKDGNFYWPAVAGAWKPHIGGGTPRHFGPCGVVLDRNAVQLFTHPERYYPYLIPVSPPIEEALLTPFYVQGKAVGTVWVVAHDTARKFDAEDMRLLESLGRFAAAAYPLSAALEAHEQQSESMREINQALMVSSLRQHELTELAQKAEAALRESEEKYRTLFEAMDEGFCIIEEVEDGMGGPVDFRYVVANPAFEAQSGVGGVVGKTIREVFPGEGKEWFETYDTIVKTGEPLRFERGLVTQGRVLELYAFRLDDETRRVAVIFKDITGRRRAEEALRESRQHLQDLNADLKSFSYATSHDLQQPLRTVMMYTQLLARKYKGRLDAQADQFIGYTVDGVQRIETLLRDLREYWSVNEQKIENLAPIDCNLVLEKSLVYLDASIQESGAAITHDSLPMVIAEEFPLTLLFQNLIGNAIKYHRPEAPPWIHLSAQRSAASWEISVTDKGIGIEAKHLEKIFAPFERLHGQEYPGTGLGLAMCQKIVERYRGRIWVESEFGQGSTFNFTLPA